MSQSQGGGEGGEPREKVIVIDDSGSEEETAVNGKGGVAAAADDPTVGDTLDFTELLSALEGPQMRFGKSRGYCCNMWCQEKAAVAAPDNIRDYYDMPSGTRARLCHSCVDNYYLYLSTAEKNLAKGGDMFELRCQQFNDCINVEGDTVEQCEVAGDRELEELIGDAIKESLDELDKLFKFDDVFARSKDQVYDRLEDFVLESGKVSADLAAVEMDLYRHAESFKSVFRTRRTSLPAVDLPLDELAPRYATRNSLDSVVQPTTLPPFGELVRPPPKLFQSVLAQRAGPNSDWIRYKFNGFLADRKLSIETTIDGLLIKRTVTGDGVAYTTVPRVRLGVGCRVVAAFNFNRGHQQPKFFYSGMVAELPTSVNQFRYLVFFDDGKAQYCPHDDLRVVYNPSKRIHEYFVGFQAEFVQNYINSFPERLMVSAESPQGLRVELKRYWITAEVEKTDGSLVLVRFPNGEPSEWIYRGSPRLRPMYDRLQSKVRSARPTGRPVRRAASQSSQLQRANTELEIVIGSSDDDEEEEEAAAEPARAVARKSTSRAPPQPPASQFRRTLEKRQTRSSIVQKYPPLMPFPQTFHQHKCSRTCVSWVKYAESKTHGFPPLAIPSIFAFQREVESVGSVLYTAPCGKKLKNIQEVLKYLSETLIPLTLDMFDFDLQTQIFDEFVVAQQYVLIEDISDKAERHPIPCINDINYECPDLMMYMTERRPLEGVNINLDPEFLVCCDCVDNCRDRSKCRCWKLTCDSFKPFNVGEDRRHITKSGYQYQRLHQNVLSGIYECNSQCKCNQVTCINRVVQHPTRHKLQLFKTAKKGWGTRCVNDIPQGAFICTYVGNILTEMAANETGTINGDEYFAELDHIEVMTSSKADFEAQAAKMTDEEADSEERTSSEEEPAEVVTPRHRQSARAVRSCTIREPNKRGAAAPAKATAKPADRTQQIVVGSSDSEEEADSIRQFYGPNETVYVMDAKIAGNIGRYFNHSCDPNIFVQNVYVDTHDLRFPWVAFFALRHIPAGAELTWDYGYRIGSVPGKVLYCHCGAANCRKRLL